MHVLQDFYITLGTGGVFLLASIIFVSTHDRTEAEIAATVSTLYFESLLISFVSLEIRNLEST